MKLPNFLIIGAAKSGTTALWKFLGQHPEIFMSPVKEPRFFAYMDTIPDFAGPGDYIYSKSIVNNINDYKKLFSGIKSEKAIGEVSPIYLSKINSAKNIHDFIPDAKIIACLRNPAKRAFSHYKHKRRIGYEKIIDFELACSKEESRLKDNYAPSWFYISRGFYYENLKSYYDLFPDQQIKIYLYDEFKKNPLSVIKDICRFLEVDDSFEPDTSQKVNESFIPRSRILFKLLNNRWKFYKYTKNILPVKIRRKIIFNLNNLWEYNKYKPELPDNIRQKLITVYRDDILKTQDLINRDLSMWLK